MCLPCDINEIPLLADMQEIKNTLLVASMRPNDQTLNNRTISSIGHDADSSIKMSNIRYIPISKFMNSFMKNIFSQFPTFLNCSEDCKYGNFQ